MKRNPSGPSCRRAEDRRNDDDPHLRHGHHHLITDMLSSSPCPPTCLRCDIFVLFFLFWRPVLEHVLIYASSRYQQNHCPEAVPISRFPIHLPSEWVSDDLLYRPKGPHKSVGGKRRNREKQQRHPTKNQRFSVLSPL